MSLSVRFRADNASESCKAAKAVAGMRSSPLLTPAALVESEDPGPRTAVLFCPSFGLAFSTVSPTGWSDLEAKTREAKPSSFQPKSEKATSLINDFGNFLGEIVSASHNSFGTLNHTETLKMTRSGRPSLWPVVLWVGVAFVLGICPLYRDCPFIRGLTLKSD